MSRLVVVTGAARGIGAAIASEFVAQGDEVVGLDVLEPSQPLESVLYVTTDVSDPGSVASAFAELEHV